MTIKGARSFSVRRLGAALAYRCDSLTVNPGEVAEVCPLVAAGGCLLRFYYKCLRCTYGISESLWRCLSHTPPPHPPRRRLSPSFFLRPVQI